MIIGEAAGVPFVAWPPANGDVSARVVIAWHLMDAPRTEAALAAEPGTEPAPQTVDAVTVDALAVSWLKRHLSASG